MIPIPVEVSMARMSHRRRLGRPLSQMGFDYDVVVVGSGYGGAIAASRLARAGKTVCVLERGREMVPGEYPDTEAKAAAETQARSKQGTIGRGTELFDVVVNDDINVLVGCGLGGTSLINANVSLEAEPAVFQDPAWPQGLRAEGALTEYYRRARDMLKPVPYPEGTEGFPRLAKTEAQRAAAQALGEPVLLAPINVNFERFDGGRNAVGVEQPPCSNCGDCCSGCNYGAKNSTLMNYIPDAHNFGAEIYCQVKVQFVRRREDGRWLVAYAPVAMGRERFSASYQFVSADVVVLGAGTLGSTEILLRSKENGLATSTMLGERFTGNGDVLGFVFNADRKIHGIGAGALVHPAESPSGPCITSVIDARRKPDLESGMVIEEGVIPGAIAKLLPTIFKVGEVLGGRETDSEPVGWLRRQWREFISWFWSLFGRGSQIGAIDQTQTMLVMSHDGAGGKISLVDGRAAVNWPEIADRPGFLQVDRQLAAVATALGGTHVPNPLWSKLLGHNLITVHPLGGCAMADDASRGVVNDSGSVFSGTAGTETYRGLFVADGAVIPRSLGVNPLLTISALAERTCEHICREKNWNIDWAPRRPATPPGIEASIGVRFTESMAGFVAPSTTGGDPDETEIYRAAEERGRTANSEFRFVFTIHIGDAAAFRQDRSHAAGLSGTVDCSFLSSEPLTATNGRFELFVPDPERVATKEMRYRATLHSVDGRRFDIGGFKRIRDDQGLDAWSDTTTLYVTIQEIAEGPQSSLLRGVLHIAPSDFLKQIRTIDVTNAPSTGARLQALASFNKFFGGELVESFGKGLGPEYLFDPDAPPREHRILRAPKAEVHSLKAADGVEIRLTRYRGGTKGPVILSPGLGVSSLIFAIDTIPTNLLEFLIEQQYDVWLLDYRTSIELNSSSAPFTGDEVAKLDYPAVVDFVRKVTGAESVQIVAHCFGATTLSMAVLSGLQGVRSIVLSQICTDVVTGPLTRIKAGLFLPDVLRTLGVQSMTAYVDQHRNWFDSLYDLALKTVYPIDPEERARSGVHRRITFLYGTLYELDQLNDATFKALHEMFGVANIAALDHLAAIVRAKHIVNGASGNAYLPNIDRWRIPTRIIHGAENACFLPKSTELAFERLRCANPPELFSRVVIPNYGHIDCIFGKNAVRDVYPSILEHLEQTH